MRRCTFAVMAVLFVLVPWNKDLRADAAHYTVENLGTLDGRVPTITGINASGQVSGYVDVGSGSLRAVRYLGDHWEYLAGLSSTYSQANGINDAGDLVGTYLVSGHQQAFRYHEALGIQTIGTLGLGLGSYGYGINTAGDVVGYADTLGGGFVGFIAPAGTTTPVPLPSLGAGFDLACGVNDSGQIVGSGFNASFIQHVFRYTPGQPMTEVASFAGVDGNSAACAIDANGVIGGQADGADATGQADGSSHAFRFDSALERLDAVFNTTSSGIESIAAGVRVGWFQPLTGPTHAFINTQADGSIDLNTLLDNGTGWVLKTAKAVNVNGTIAGEGTLNGARAVFRLTKVPSAPADTTPPVIHGFTATPNNITPPDGTTVAIQFFVDVTDDTDPSPTCTLTGVNTHGAPASSASITDAAGLKGSVLAAANTRYTFSVSCSDAGGHAMASSADVVVPPDTTAPVFTSLIATPSTLSPTGLMVTVTMSATASDDSGQAPACALNSITPPAGTPAGDYLVVNGTTGSVRAIGGRTYVFNEVCTDGSGNPRAGSVNVNVTADRTAPTIDNVSATPSTVWPPNGKWVAVDVSAHATDDVDANPSCALTSISGAPAGDYEITGAFTANVRASRNADGSTRVYSLNVGCHDTSGNTSTASAFVSVTKEAAGKALGRQ